MKRRFVYLAAAIAAMPLLAMGQGHSQPAPDPGCFPGGAKATIKRAGGLSVLNVKYPNGTTICEKGNACKMPVVAMSFKRADSGELACCMQIENAKIDVKYKNEDVPITWKLSAADSSSYTFAVNGLAAFNESNGKRPKKDEIAASMTDATGTELSAVSVNKHRGQKKFGYYLNVLMKVADNKYLVCDPADPVIVNNGN